MSQVQTLLQAEKEASQVVAKAKSCKSRPLTTLADRIQRLKDARAEAQKEIETLKAQKNQEFIEYEKKYAGDTGENVKEAERETIKQLEVIASDFAKNKQSVIAKLLQTIGECKPQIHANAKPPKAASA
ncbi:H(+)-transporting V1 sector ATPase subunit G [Kappamyces sp. JEL0680]|nr:H(+)-transporting V1 sector ATPase subunit G [Kappamyces sp. JEL0680]